MPSVVCEGSLILDSDPLPETVSPASNPGQRLEVRRSRAVRQPSMLPIYSGVLTGEPGGASSEGLEEEKSSG